MYADKVSVEKKIAIPYQSIQSPLSGKSIDSNLFALSQVHD